MHYKLTTPKAQQYEVQINEAFMAVYSVQNPNDTITTGYVKVHIILGFGYILKDSYTEQFIDEADVIEIVEDLPSLFPAYFADLNTELSEGSAILVVDGKVTESLPKAEIQIAGGTEQQLLEWVFSEDFDLSGLPEWSSLIVKYVEKGTWCRFNGKPYVCTLPHTVQADWTPDIAVSLWTKHLPDGVIGDWRQPQGQHDAYKLGMRVRHIGWIWEVTETDANGNNVWEPGVFGWTQIEQIEMPEPPSENPCDDIPEWDDNEGYTNMAIGDLRKVEVEGVWKVYAVKDLGFVHYNPSGPYGHYGWEYQYDCPTE